jgi:hypothetical protein
MDLQFKDLAPPLATLVVAGIAFYQWKRTRRSGQFIADREVTYKEVWASLEDVNLFVRTGGYTRAAFEERMRDTNTLVLKRGLHIEEHDTTLVGRYLNALAETGRVLTTDRADRAFRELQSAMYTTAASVSLEDLVPEYKTALRELDESRRAVIRRFREVLGADYT